MKKKIIFGILFVVGGIIFPCFSKAQGIAEPPKTTVSSVAAALPENATPPEKITPILDYGSGLVLDSDLDGLTDLGEKEIFKTDPNNPDTDGDGFLDGAEVLNGTNPLDNTSPVATRTITEKTFPAQKEAAWPWYTVRAAGLISFALLYIVMFLGLSIRMPGLKRLIAPINSLNIHAWLSLQALLLVFVHGGALLFDKFFKFSLADITIPFASQIYTNQMAVGILAMYLMVILVVTAYTRKFLNHKLWRAIHVLNVLLYIGGAYHALTLGTDLASGTPRQVFIWANVALGILLVINILVRIFSFIRNRFSSSNVTS